MNDQLNSLDDRLAAELREALDSASTLRNRERAYARTDRALAREMTSGSSSRRVVPVLRRPLRTAVVTGLVVLAVSGVAAANSAHPFGFSLFGKPETSKPSAAAKATAERESDMVAATPPGFESPGAVDVSRTRVALEAATDAVNAEISMTPAGDSGVCYSSRITLKPDGPTSSSGGCLPALGNDWPAKTMIRTAIGGQPMAFGIFPDDVTGVVVRSTSGSAISLSGESGYLWIGSSKDDVMEELGIEYSDGTTKSWPVEPVSTKSVPRPGAEQ
jgi:hypothetical protein